jgi:hypothetical protein
MKKLKKEHNLLMIEKIKHLFEGEIKWEFEKPKKELIFLNIKTKIFFHQELFEVELIIGRQKIFFANPTDESSYEDRFYDIFLNLSDGKIDESLEQEKENSLFTSVITDLTLENYKQRKEYKMHSLYDTEFNQRFENKVIYDNYNLNK